MARPQVAWSLFIHTEIQTLTNTIYRSQRFQSDQSNSTSPVQMEDNVGKFILASTKRSQNVVGARLITQAVFHLNKNHLLLPFFRLEAILNSTANLRDLDPFVLLEPFLNVVSKGETTGIVTGMALKTLERFIEYRILDPFHPDIQNAVDQLSYSLTRCKFEATDYVGDELVLQSLLTTMTRLMDSDLKRFITDKSMYDMFRVSVGIVFQPRVSEHLRKAGEDSILSMTGKIMERFVDITNLINWNEPSMIKSKMFGLHTVLELIQWIASLLDPHDHKHTDTLHRYLAMKTVIKISEVGSKCLGTWIRYGQKVRISHHVPDRKDEQDHLEHVDVGGVIAPDVDVNEMAKDGVDGNEVEKPVVQDPLKEQIVQESPMERQSEVINEQFHITFASSLYRLFTNDISKHLLNLILLQPQFVSNPPSPTVLNVIQMILKCLLAVLGICDDSSDQIDVLFAHREFLIGTICDRIETGLSLWDLDRWSEDVVFTAENATPTTPTSSKVRESVTRRVEVLDPTVRYLYIQSLQHLLTPDTILRMWTNNDCEEWSSTFQVRDTIRSVCQMGVGDTKGVLGTGVLLAGLDCILMMLKKWNDRIPVDNNSKSQELSALIQVEQAWEKKRKLKSIVLEGSALFAENIKSGIEFFQKQGLLPEQVTDDDLAAFFYNSTLDKTQVGNYLAKPKHVPLLQKFSDYFDFKGKRIDEALRHYLDKFRLPGESQQIERILDTFAKRYFESHSEDSECPIASVDATGILAFSIIMLNTDQHNPQVRKKMSLTDYERNVRGLNDGVDFPKEFIKDIYNAIKENEIVLAEEHGDAFMHQFASITKKMNKFNENHQGLEHLDRLENVEDMMMIEKLVTGIRYCVTIAAAYDLDDMLEFVVSHLSKMTGLVKQDKLPTEVDVLLKRDAKKSDRWLIDLGQNYRSQVSCVLLFTIANEFGEGLGKSWYHVLNILGNLFLHQCLPIDLLTAEHFVSKQVTIPRVLVSKPVEEPRKEGGLFSSFAQFLTLASENEDFFDPQAIEWEGYAMECIEHCAIKDLIEETKFLTTDTCLQILNQLVELSIEKSEPANDNSKPNFTASAVFYMEFIFWILLKNRDRIKSLWSGLDHYWTLVMAPSTPVVLVERCCTNILKLLLRLTHSDVQSQVFQVLEKLTSLPTETILTFGEHLVNGFLTVAKTDFSVLSRTGRCQVLFRVLSVTATQPFASTVCFELMSMVVGGHAESPLTSEYFGDVVDLLVSFSSGVYGTSAPRSSVSKTPSATDTNKYFITNDRLSKTPVGGSQAQLALERALQTMEKLYHLHTLIPKWVSEQNTSPERQWFEYWLPILSGLGQQCVHPSIEVRHQALVYLQRLLLSNELQTVLNVSVENRIECFDIVLFPLAEILSTTNQLDPIGLGETNLRLSNLITKILLQYAHHLNSVTLTRIWNQILEYLLRMAKNDMDHVREAILESVKNVVLVLSADGILVQECDLWKATWDKLDLVFPGLQQELIANSPKKQPEPVLSE